MEETKYGITRTQLMRLFGIGRGIPIENWHPHKFFVDKFLSESNIKEIK